MTEQDIMNSIRIKLSEMGFTVFRANVGKFKLADGRWFDVGLPKGFCCQGWENIFHRSEEAGW